MFIVFEGIDGTGKSTQAKRLADFLRKDGHQVTLSREPTDGPYGMRLRASAESGRMTAAEEIETFILDRKDHLEKTILPALAAGHFVILDRYYFSSMAYQSRSGFTPDDVRRRNQAFAPDPDILFILDLDVPTAISRIGIRGDTINKFEQTETLAHCRKVYLSLAEESFAKCIDTTSTPDQIATAILEYVTEKIAENAP